MPPFKMRIMLSSLAIWLSIFTLEAFSHMSLWEKKITAANRLLHHQINRPHIATTAEPNLGESPFLNANSSRFAVNGSAIPDVHFNIGESYAGSLPISADANETSNLFFWFFPTISPNATRVRDIVIWLNGGPGCSSLLGLIDEHGPLIWQPGTFRPVRNNYSWHKLAHIVYIEQPVGTGFSRGDVTALSEEDIAAQFLGFWKNFVDTFKLHGFNVYITGESYAGQYCPYFASAMLDRNDTTYYNVTGMMIYDPLFASGYLQDFSVVPFARHWSAVFAFNDTFRASLDARADACGYDSFLAKYFTFPPPGPFPLEDDLPGLSQDCEHIWPDILDAASELNPCFNVYHVTDTCPFPWDVLGRPGMFAWMPSGAEIYFSRPEVQAAIHAPDDQAWSACSWFPVFTNGDNSPPASWGALPHVIDATKNVIISHGDRDYILFSNSTLLGIQNMTWGGAQGFQNKPTEPFFVPSDSFYDPTALAGSGVMGTVISERGLTYVGVTGAGHMVPEFAPGAAFRQLEFMLGRVKCLNCKTVFTTDENPDAQSNQPMGNGTMP
ncbi:hypothetical protein OQA88_6916 [Cercophora sp. LCS_1]